MAEHDKRDQGKATDVPDPSEEKPTTDSDRDSESPNPPRTTTGWFTAPKFGSAGSGGAELEPGLDRN